MAINAATAYSRRLGVVRPRRQSDDRQAGGRDEDPDPLAASESQAEEALGEDGQEHEPAREHGLHDRQRRQRERADVKPPGSHRHGPAGGTGAGEGESAISVFIVATSGAKAAT